MKNKLIVAVLALIILVPLVYNLFGQDAEFFLEKPKSGKCIREAEYMRFNHMIILKEARDQAMRKGKKPETNLKNCQQCHPSREQFCDRCHSKVNLSPDCFGCHYYPK